MKSLLLIVLFCMALTAHGQEEISAEISAAAANPIFKDAAVLYAQGQYSATSTELGLVEQSLAASKTTDKATLGFLAYWRGICFNRLQDFASAISQFDKSLGLGFTSIDVNYEYGQALFAAEKLSEARVQFRESVKKKFKRAVSLYYIAYISKEMGEKKKAVSFYKAIQKLDAEEAKEVRQASEMQIADIYLEQAEKHPDAFRAVETYVIPQYKVALKADPESQLANQIQEKIRKLQQRYDLVLFRLRNGRPTNIPPYFARIAAEIGNDSNVTFSPDEQAVSESKKRSAFAKTDILGRYTFYHRDYISVSPELRFNATRYLNRVPEIYRNDNYLIAPAIRTAYEHTLWNKPASILFDYDYNDAKRDVNAEEKLEFSFRSHTIMIGERFNYFPWGESVVRLKRRLFDSYIDTSDANAWGLSFEQVRNYKDKMLLFYASYDMNRVENDLYDTNALTLRLDLIHFTAISWAVPTVGVGVTRTNPINDDVRGTEYMLNPSARLTKNFKKNWRGNLKFDYQQNTSNDEENFAYKKYLYSFELEYIF